MTPAGSACSIAIGVVITTMQPGSLEGLLMVVSDVQAVREELVKRGADISEIDVQPWGLLPILVILMAIAGLCSNSPAASSFYADARSAISGVEDDRTASALNQAVDARTQ